MSYCVELLFLSLSHIQYLTVGAYSDYAPGDHLSAGD